MPALPKGPRSVLWVAVGVFCAVFTLAVIVPGIRSRGPRPSENLKRFDGAIDHSRQTYDHAKSELYVRASLALKKGDAQAAEALYREVLAKYPNDSDGYDALGACLCFQHRYEEARTNYLLGLKLNAQSVDALYGLGCVAYEQGRNTEAKDYLEKALLLDQKNPLCHRVLGSVYEQLGDVPKAVSHYELAVSLEPSVAGDDAIRRRLDELKR